MLDNGAQFAATLIDPNFKTPYSQNWNLGVQHAITPTVTIEVNYVGVKGDRLYRVVDGNPPQPSSSCASRHLPIRKRWPNDIRMSATGSPRVPEPYKPLSGIIADESSLTSYTTAFDFDFHPANIAAFQQKLEARLERTRSRP